MIYEQIIPAFISMPGPGELLIIGLIGVLLFGNRLPDVGRSLGKGIVEFKKGIKGVDSDIEKALDKGKEDKENS